MTMKRLLKGVLVTSGLLWVPMVAAKGPDFSIFEVRRQLALSNEEKTEKDYYVYAGTEDGVKEGTVYDVVRTVPLYDGVQNRSLGEMKVKVAQVKVIFADKSVSVARYYKDFSREALPVLREDYILLGDVLDVTSAAKTAANEAVPEESAPAAAEQGVQLVINSVDVSEKLSH